MVYDQQKPLASAHNSPVQPFERIDGVFTVPLRTFHDERGQFMETFRREWFPWIDWDRVQNNRSDSRAGVVRGLHYHFQQVDYWHVAAGRVRAGLVDLRRSSRTFMKTATIDLGETDNLGLLIPVGVAHGFAAVTDCTLMYLVNNYYDGGRDEFGVAWDDPDIALPWGIEQATAQLSPRDGANPRLRDIPAANLPE
jgi:dTDP-4-dehydrorhamnose 3,5-epimerase